MGGKAIIITASADPRLTNFLAGLGYSAQDILVCSGADEALAALCNADLLFLQLSSGDSIAQADMIPDLFPTTPIIICTAPGHEAAALKLLQHGAQDYIVLSEISADTFQHIISKALSRKHFSNRLDESNRRLQDEVQREKRRLDHILSSINEVVWSCTADTFETIYINNACYSIYGYTPEEIIGECGLLFGCVHPEDRKYYKRAWRELLKNGKFVFEYRILHRDGTIKYIKNEAVLRRDADNIPRFINGFARDVTIQKMQMLRIQKQNEVLREIAWIQSHKVRGPLSSIMGLTSLFDAQTDNSEVIGHLQAAANNLDEVIREIVTKSEC